MGLLFSASLWAQQTLNSGGQTFSNANGSFSQSVGELIYHSINNSNYILEEGIQHADIQIATPEPSLREFKSSVSPNPVKGYINLTCINSETPIVYTLYDMTGKCHKSQSILSCNTKIDVQDLPPAIYYLTLRESGRILSNHKLIIQ